MSVTDDVAAADDGEQAEQSHSADETLNAEEKQMSSSLGLVCSRSEDGPAAASSRERAAGMTIVSEMTYTVSSGTLNSTIPLPYHTCI